MVIYILTGCAILFYTWFIVRKWKFLIFASKQNGFFIPVLPLVGTMYLPFVAGYKDNVIAAIGFLGDKFGFPFNLWFGHNYTYVTSDPSEAKAVLYNLSAQNKGIAYRDISYVFKNSLLTIPYNEWRIRRKQYAKSFKPQSLKTLCGIYYKGSSELVKNIQACKDEAISYDFFTKYTFLNFFYTSTGLDNEPKGMHRFGECLMAFQEDVAQKMLDPVTPPEIWMRFFPGGRNTAKHMKEMREISKQIIEEKTCQRSDFKAFVESVSAPPLLDLMMSIKGSILDDEGICDDLLFFSAASADTSGHTLMIAFTLLGMYPHIQEKIYEEIIKTVGQNQILNDDLPALVYTEAVVFEILRLFPVIPLVGRIVDKDIDIGSKIIPKGSNVCVSIYHLQRDEKYWPNPLKFDPSRFLPENASQIDPTTYIAFSSGPRDCLGKAQAMAMLKISIASVVRHFRIFSNHKSIDELSVMSSITLRTVHNLDCHFKTRVKN